METSKSSGPAEAERLPVAALLAFAMTGFICIATETLPAGLLPQISQGLELSSALAGQLVTAYALGSVLAVIPLTIVTSAWPRRHALLLTIVGFMMFNGITAVSSNFLLTLAARFLAGCAAGLAWGLLAPYARRLVPAHLQGRALAVAMVGTPVALSIGVPLGTWLGSVVGWRVAFELMSGLALLLAGWVLIAVPNRPGRRAATRLPISAVVQLPGVRPVLAVVAAWMLAHNILYTYIAPFTARAGLTGRVDLVLLIFGIAALVGIFVTGHLVDRLLRRTVLTSLGTFAVVAAVFGIATPHPIIILLGVAIWGISFGGAATLLQTALADTAGDHADIALSLNVVTWNAAIAGGGILGGVLLDHWGAASFSWAVLALTAAGFLIAWWARLHGFPIGERRHTAFVAAH